MKKGDAVSIKGHFATVTAVTRSHVFVLYEDGHEEAIRMRDALDLVDAHQFVSAQYALL